MIPEGITINYLADVPTTLTFHTFTPVEVDAPQVEDAIVRELTAHPPDRVLMVSRDLREYGARGFGVDYDLRAGALIRSQLPRRAHLARAAVSGDAFSRGDAEARRAAPPRLRARVKSSAASRNVTPGFSFSA